MVLLKTSVGKERYQSSSNQWFKGPRKHSYKYLKETECIENVFQGKRKQYVFGPSTLYHQVLTANSIQFKFIYEQLYFWVRNAVLVQSHKKQLNCALF